LKLSKVLSERNVHHWFDIRQESWLAAMEGNVSSLLILNQIFLDSGIQYERHNII
jgi:hypothetical protein